MDHPKTPSFWREKTYDAGHTLFDVTPWEPAFEHLVTAMRAEFSRMFETTEQLRLENRILHAKLETATQHVNRIKTETGPSKKIAGASPSDEGPLPTPTWVAEYAETPSSSSDTVRFTRMEDEPGIEWGTEEVNDVPTHKAPIMSSGSRDLSAAKPGTDADEHVDTDAEARAARDSRFCKVDSTQSVGSVESVESRAACARDSRFSISSVASPLMILDVWNGKPRNVLRSGGRKQLSRELSMGWSSVRAGDDLKENSVFQLFVLHPWRSETWAWDTVVALVAIYDLIMVPLQMMELVPVTMFALDLTTACVWTLDILVGCLRGRDIGGVVDMRPSRIAKAYLRTWFVLDFVLVALDWILIMAASTKLDVVRSVRLRRALRLLRVMRILRITKILRSFRRMQKQVPMSDFTEAFSSVIKHLLIMWLINHYVACGWYAIGDVGMEPNWIATTFDENDSIAFRYSTAYHWSLTQVIPASMEVVPTNALERAYSVGAIFFGLVMFTSFVSHMTNAVARIRQLNEATDKQRRDLRNYVEQHHVSFGLGRQIEAYMQTASKRMKLMRLLESDIAVLRMLPEYMLNKLREEVFTPTLCAHPFFEKFQDVERSAFISICNVAAAEKHVMVGEELFRCGQVATKTYFSTGGHLTYFEGFHGYDASNVPEGSWFSEAALWCAWTHRGRMMSCDNHAEVVTVDAAETNRMMSATTSFYQVQRYAKKYCVLAVEECGSKEFVTDTWGGTHSVAMAVRHAWAPSVHDVISLMLQSSEDWYVNAFHAWKAYTAEAVEARLQSAGFLKRAVLPFVVTMRRQLPLAGRREPGELRRHSV